MNKEKCQGLAWVLVFAIVLILSTACSPKSLWPGKNAAAQAETTPKIMKVQVVKAARRQVAAMPMAEANLEPIHTYSIDTATGGTVQKVFVSRGAMVKAGDLLAQLTSGDVALEKEKAEISLENARAALHAAAQGKSAAIHQAQQEVDDLTRNYNKLRNDYDEGLATKSQVDQAAAQLSQKQSDLAYLKQHPNGASGNPADRQLQVQMAEMSVKQAQQDLDNLSVKAPDNGILTDFSLSANEVLPPGAEIGVLQKLDPIQLVAQLNGDQVGMVKEGGALGFSLPDTNITGQASIRYLAKIPDPKTGKYELDLDTPNPGLNLKPGMTVQLQLLQPEQLIGLTVPSYSVIRSGSLSYVFIVNGHTVEKRQVQLGRLNEPNQEILSGLQEGAWVVVSGQNQLTNGEQVDAVPLSN